MSVHHSWRVALSLPPSLCLLSQPGVFRGWSASWNAIFNCDVYSLLVILTISCTATIYFFRNTIKDKYVESCLSKPAHIVEYTTILEILLKHILLKCHLEKILCTYNFVWNEKRHAGKTLQPWREIWQANFSKRIHSLGTKLGPVFAANAQQINIIWVYVSKPGAFEVHSIPLVFVL